MMTKFELMATQLHLVNRAINRNRSQSWEEFVKLDRYRQDMEMEMNILENCDYWKTKGRVRQVQTQLIASV